MEYELNKDIYEQELAARRNEVERLAFLYFDWNTDYMGLSNDIGAGAITLDLYDKLIELLKGKIAERLNG